MSEQGSSTTNNTPGAHGATGANGTTTTTTAGPDVGEMSRAIEASTAALKAAHAKIDAIERDNAAYRERERQRKQGEEEAKRKAGDLEPLLAERESTIAEMRRQLSELEPAAKAWSTHMESVRAEIAEAAKSLDEGDRKALDAVSDLSARRHLLTRLIASKQAASAPAAKERPKALPDATASHAGGDDIDDATLATMSPGEIQKKHPRAWARLMTHARPKPGKMLEMFRPQKA